MSNVVAYCMWRSLSWAMLLLKKTSTRRQTSFIPSFFLFCFKLFVLPMHPLNRKIPVYCFWNTEIDTSFTSKINPFNVLQIVKIFQFWARKIQSRLFVNDLTITDRSQFLACAFISVIYGRWYFRNTALQMRYCVTLNKQLRHYILSCMI